MKKKIFIFTTAALFFLYFSNPDIFDYSHFIRKKYEEKSSGEKNGFAFYLFDSIPRPSGSQIIDNNNERLNENMKIAIFSKQNNFKFFSIFSTTFPLPSDQLKNKNYVDYKFLGLCGFFINIEDNLGLLEKNSLADEIEISIPEKLKKN